MRCISWTILCFLVSLNSLSGQQCKSAVYRAEQISNTPHLDGIRQQRSILLAQQLKQKNSEKNNTVLKLPLVFHIIYNTTSQNIDSSQIASQIDVLNRDFRLLNDNLNILQGGFVSLATDPELEFKLADKDPDDNPTNGITRTFTSNPALGGSSNDYYDPAKGGVAAWDAKRYINVWVLNINSAGGDFGFASFPGEADPVTSDGVVIDYKYCGTTGTAANSMPQHLGRTMTHELGHYFGLFHIWGDVDDCSADDEIGDTPLQETSTDGCRAYPAYDNCSSAGDGVNFYNFMDYTDDECMAMFTADQVAKMKAVISLPFADGGRSELVELFSSKRELTKLSLKVYPNPVTHSIGIDLDNPSLVGQHLEIYDIKGRMISKHKVSQSHLSINMSTYKEGIYLVRIITQQAIWSQKVVVIK